MPRLQHLPFRRYLHRAAVLTFLSCSAVSLPAAEPHHQHDSDWLIFLSGEGVGRSGFERLGPHDYDSIGRGDILLTHSTDRFRALAETVVSTEEVDVERLQIGVETSENTLIWLGRFHQPASAWNTEHHHGQYLQTAITRPSIELWEDDGGLIPQHIAGALFETRQPLGKEQGLHVAIGVGAGSLLTPDGLEPLRIFKANSGNHRLSWTARVAWLPDFLGPTSAGVLLGHNELRVAASALSIFSAVPYIKQDIYGAYLDWNVPNWRVIAAGYYVDLAWHGVGASPNEHFGAGYVQAEHQLPKSFTLFGRHENSFNAGNSRFVALQTQTFDMRRNALGVRWDFARRQALTLELARTTRLTDDFSEYRLQWSAVVP
jgi:hypothetical protein